MILRPDILKILITGRYRQMRNQLFGQNKMGTLFLILLFAAFWIFIFYKSFIGGSEDMVANREQSIPYWHLLFGATFFYAVLYPIRLMKAGKTGLGRFRFLPVSYPELVIYDWIERLMTIQNFIILLFLFKFGYSYFNLEEFPFVLAHIIIWMLFLQTVIRVVSAIMFSLKQKKWYFAQFSVVLFLVLYFLIIKLAGTGSGLELLTTLNSYWITGLMVTNLFHPSLQNSLLILGIFGVSLVVDFFLFWYLEKTEERVSSSLSEKTEKVNMIQNPWWAAIRRHPTFGIFLLMGPFIGFFTGSVNFSDNPAQHLFEMDTKLTWMVIGTSFWFYAAGILGPFILLHLTLDRPVTKLLFQLKTAYSIFILASFLLLMGFDGYQLFSTPLFMIWVVKMAWIVTFCLIFSDLMVLANAWVLIKIPAKGGFNVPTTQRLWLAAFILGGMFLMMTATDYIMKLILTSPEGQWILLIGFTGVILTSLFYFPVLISRVWVSRREKMTDLLKGNS